MNTVHLRQHLLDGSGSRINAENKQIVASHGHRLALATQMFYKVCLLACIILAVYVPNLQAVCNWGPSYNYDNGENPRVAVDLVNGVELAVEVHNGGDGRMWYHSGLFSYTTINFRDSYNYDYGENPSVAATNSTYPIEVHSAGNGVGLCGTMSAPATMIDPVDLIP